MAGGERSSTPRTWWLTAGFWFCTALFAYRLIGVVDWWAHAVYAGAGGVLTYFWWRRLRRTRFTTAWALAGAVAALSVGALALSALALSASATFAAVTAPVDSVGQREVHCGTVMRPVPADELRVTSTAASDELAVEAHGIPQGELHRVCSSRLARRAEGIVGTALVGLLAAARAAARVAVVSRSRAAAVTPA